MDTVANVRGMSMKDQILVEAIPTVTTEAVVTLNCGVTCVSMCVPYQINIDPFLFTGKMSINIFDNCVFKDKYIHSL